MSRGSGWYGYDGAAGRLTLVLHVQPNAGRDEIAGLHGDALKVRIAAPATDNRANARLVEFLAGVLGVPKSAVRIRRGATGRHKILEVAVAAPLAERLVAAVAGAVKKREPGATP